MDIKLWQAIYEKRVLDHIKMSSDFSRKFLSNFDINKKTLDIIIECIEWHHWKEKFNNLEAEITANSDCYRFLSSRLIIHFLVNSKKMFWDNFLESIKFIESKMDEKMNIVSLDLLKKELEPVYKDFKKYFKDCNW